MVVAALAKGQGVLVTRVILMLKTSTGSVRRAGELQSDDAKLLFRVMTSLLGKRPRLVT